MCTKGAMQASITREVSMGHRLPDHKGKCRNLHGHNYQISVTIEGQPEADGMIIDFAYLKAYLSEVLRPMDHAMVLWDQDPWVEILRKAQIKGMFVDDQGASSPTLLYLLPNHPSAENIALHLFDRMNQKLRLHSDLKHVSATLVSVKVQETEDGWAECRRDNPN